MPLRQLGVCLSSYLDDGEFAAADMGQSGFMAKTLLLEKCSIVPTQKGSSLLPLPSSSSRTNYQTGYTNQKHRQATAAISYRVQVASVACGVFDCCLLSGIWFLNCCLGWPHCQQTTAFLCGHNTALVS